MTEKKIFSIDNISAEIRETPVSITSFDGKEEVPFPADEVPKGIRYVLNNDESKDPAKYCLLGIEKDLSVMFVGPKGTGKTTTAAFIAQELNKPLMYMQMTGSTGVDSFVGKWLIRDGATYWVDGILTRAMKFGYILVLDELNMALPEITAVLHGVMDERKILVLDDKGAGEVIKAHPDFRIIAAINPSGDYEGTKEINEALMDRFKLVVNVGYPDPRKERTIVMEKPQVQIDDDQSSTTAGKTKEGVITRMIEVANACRKPSKYNPEGLEFSTRNLIDWATLSAYLPIYEAAELTILSKLESEEVKGEVAKAITVKFNENEVWVNKTDREALTKKRRLEDYNQETEIEL